MQWADGKQGAGKGNNSVLFFFYIFCYSALVEKGEKMRNKWTTQSHAG